MKRCICGKSGRHPICDGSHSVEGWACRVDEGDSVGMVVVGSGSLHNVVERLAHEFGGVALTSPTSELHTDRLVVLSDGQNLHLLQSIFRGVHARHRILIPIGLDARVASWAFNDFDIHPIGDVPESALWSSVVATLRAEPAPQRISAKPSVFLSHAIRDEPRLVGVLAALRRDFGVEVFSCSDSIRSGTEWQPMIQAHLEACDVFVFVASEAANRSVYCAFESGYALACDTPVHLVDIDGSGPPTHLGRFQAASFTRQKALQPWLNDEELMLDCFLRVLAHAEHRA